jgi:hypothetical protein
MKVERIIERGRRETRGSIRRDSIESILSEDDIRSLMRRGGESGNVTATDTDGEMDGEMDGGTTGDEFEEAIEDEFEEAVKRDEKGGLLAADQKI